MFIFSLGKGQCRAIQYNGTNHLEIENFTNRKILFDIDSQVLLNTEDNMPVNTEEWVLEYGLKEICEYYVLSTKSVLELTLSTQIQKIIPTAQHFSNEHSDSELKSQIAKIEKRLQNLKALFRVNGGVLSEEQERFWSPDNWANLQLRGFPEHSIHRVAIYIIRREAINTLSPKVQVLYMDKEEGGLVELECDLHGRWLGLDNGIPQSYDIIERIPRQGAHNE